MARDRRPERDDRVPDVTGRLPPHDLDAEAAVISACCLDPRALDDALAIVRPEHAYADRHRRILEAIAALHAAGRPVDIVQVAGWLRTHEQLASVGMDYLAEVVNATPAVANVGAHAATVRDKARMRRMILACQELAAMGYVHDGGAQGFLDACGEKILGIARDENQGDFESLGAVLERRTGELREAWRTGKRLPGLPSGFAALDGYIHGWRKQRLHIVAARPGCGKSSLALQTALFVARFVPGAHVAFFTLEMSKEELADRAVCLEALIDGDHVARAALSIAEWQRYDAAARQLATAGVHLIANADTGVQQVRGQSARLRAKVEKSGGHLALVVVDYLQLMSAPADDRKRSQTRDQEVGAITRALKRLAMDLDVPVIALSQLNRGRDENERPTLARLRESGSIEQDSDVVLFVHRVAEKRDARPPGSGYVPRTCELIVAKARGAKCGTAHVTFDGRFTRFEEIEARDAVDAEAAE